MERTVGASDWAMTKNSLPDLMEVMRTSISPETATSVGCVVSVLFGCENHCFHSTVLASLLWHHCFGITHYITSLIT